MSGPASPIRRTRRGVVALTALVLALAVASGAAAVDVRGRVDLQTRRGIVPMSRAFVELCNTRLGCASYETGYDGMYYLELDPGPHDLLVNRRLRLRVVIPNTRYFDIRPVLGN